MPLARHFPATAAILRWVTRRPVLLILRLLMVVLLFAFLALRIVGLYSHYQAESLLADLRSFEFNRTTGADALAALERYGERIDYRPCTPEECVAEYEITHSFFDWSAALSHVAPHAMSSLGERPWRVVGGATINDGRVVGVYYSTLVRKSDGSYLSARTSTYEQCEDWRARKGADCNYYAIQPSLTIEGGGEAVAAYITPRATDDQKHRALDFDLSCFIAIGGCRDLADLMPAAWEDLHARRAQF